jgi:site-specific recombinase XerD
LSADEVQRILGCIRQPRYRVCLTTIYAAGLRIHEGLHLQVPQIDSGRMLIHIQGVRAARIATFPSPHSC